MKNLLYVLAISLLLAACGTDATPEKGFQPYKSGLFTIVSKKEADWDGLRGAKNSIPMSVQNDTTEDGVPIYVSDYPDKSRMSMKFYRGKVNRRSLPHTVEITYKDSLLNQQFEDSLDFKRGFVYSPIIETNDIRFSAGPEVGYLELKVHVDCDPTKKLYDGRTYFPLNFHGKDYNNEGKYTGQTLRFKLKVRIGDIDTPILDLCREQNLIK